uniref:Secreted protein n=1 Tax=Physcomitrium patens TaxID=3218 RepID=A0A2K1KJA0_PHYPA|nr:hypothetical protein PHYPA_007518 [Physcomitrium patens]
MPTPRHLALFWWSIALFWWSRIRLVDSLSECLLVRSLVKLYATSAVLRRQRFYVGRPKAGLFSYTGIRNEKKRKEKKQGCCNRCSQ